MLIFGTFAIMAILIWAYELRYWLVTHTWQPLLVRDFVRPLLPKETYIWIRTPDEWVEAAHAIRVLLEASAAWTLVLLGLLFAVGLTGWPLRSEPSRGVRR